MSEFSSQMQAVLQAACIHHGLFNEEIAQRRRMLAAVLRAAVDQVVPEHREHYPATLDERYRKVSAFDVRNKFLAIAAQLEA